MAYRQRTGVAAATQSVLTDDPDFLRFIVERVVQEVLDTAVRMGVEHGLFCLGCCWLLFAILFPLGVMNIAVMAAIALLIFAEKSLPIGLHIGRIAAAALITYGLLVMVVPHLPPTMK